MDHADILIVNALKMELDALVEVLESLGAPLHHSKTSDFLTTTVQNGGEDLVLALARPTRMGATPVATVASTLIERLKPRCLAMSGVCAGNPSEVALGDVVVAEMAYAYDEGKKAVDGFYGDHRQVPLMERWLRRVQECDVTSLPSYGKASEEEARVWLLELLAAGGNPMKHPARIRYLDGALWKRP